MHWRTQFPPKNASVLAELIAVFHASFQSELVMATELPDELPPASESICELPSETASAVR